MEPPRTSQLLGGKEQRHLLAGCHYLTGDWEVVCGIHENRTGHCRPLRSAIRRKSWARHLSRTKHKLPLSTDPANVDSVGLGPCWEPGSSEREGHRARRPGPSTGAETAHSLGKLPTCSSHRETCLLPPTVQRGPACCNTARKRCSLAFYPQL